MAYRNGRFAALDIGTVTCRLLVADVDAGRIREVAKEYAITDLGVGVDATGRLSQEAIERVLSTVDRYREVLARNDGPAHPVERLIAMATSASRDAENGADFVRQLAEHGVSLAVIPGEREAQLTFVGASSDFPGENLLVVDIGGGTTEGAVISLGGIVTSSSLRLAGNRLDEAIAMHLRDLLGIKIGERTAEVIKIKIGSILPFEDGRERDMIISGQDVYTEQPKEVTIQSEDVRAALQAPIEEMVLHIKDTFKKTNPDLASDIIQNGILLTGGGGLLSGLDRYLTDKLEIPVWVSETALTNVVSGCLKVLETPTALKQTLMRSK